MTERGVFAVDRGIWDHDLFADDEPFSRREAWLWLISEAAWKPHRRRVAGRAIEVNRGQVVASLRFLAGKWRWSEPRVRRFIDTLKNDSMIVVSADAGVNVITICKYDEYQRVSLPSDAPSDAVTDAGATQERRKVEDKEDKEDKEKISKPKKVSRPRGEPLPVDWEPDREFARSKGFSEGQINEQEQRFRDHAAANRRLQADWPAAWRNWITSPYQRAGPVNGHGAAPRPGSREDRQERLANVLQTFDPRTRPHADDDRRGESPAAPVAGLLPFGRRNGP